MWLRYEKGECGGFMCGGMGCDPGVGVGLSVELGVRQVDGGAHTDPTMMAGANKVPE